MIRLLELRNEKGLSQREMAKHLNISQGTYNNWENANTEPSISQLITLATFFDVTVDYLIGNDANDSVNLNKSISLFGENEKIIKLYNNLNKETQESILNILEHLS